MHPGDVDFGGIIVNKKKSGGVIEGESATKNDGAGSMERRGQRGGIRFHGRGCKRTSTMQRQRDGACARITARCRDVSRWRARYRTRNGSSDKCTMAGGEKASANSGVGFVDDFNAVAQVAEQILPRFSFPNREPPPPFYPCPFPKSRG